ncbi:hypothetical protein T484DRAFT_3358431 [Baffinella frigidus]|nr:hypothetical protein T484DRAFT_3358431 [Cryptophyta sp. CCMP2293]
MAGGGADVALALKTLALKDRCSHCGEQSEVLKKCSVCKQAFYCGAECQNAAWKKHKKSCMSPAARRARFIETVNIKMSDAHGRGDYEQVILLGRLAEKDLALLTPDDIEECPMHRFLLNSMGHAFTRQQRYSEAVPYYERLAALFASQGHFIEQGQALMNLGRVRMTVGARVEAAAIYEKVRDMASRIWRERMGGRRRRWSLRRRRWLRRSAWRMMRQGGRVPKRTVWPPSSNALTSPHLTLTKRSCTATLSSATLSRTKPTAYITCCCRKYGCDGT